MHESTLLFEVRAAQIKLRTPLSISPKASLFLRSSKPSFLRAADTWLMALEAGGEEKPQRAPSWGRTLVLLKIKRDVKGPSNRLFIPGRNTELEPQLPSGERNGVARGQRRERDFLLCILSVDFEFWPRQCIPHGKQYICFNVCLFVFSAVLRTLWNLSSLIRDWTWALGSDSAES